MRRIDGDHLIMHETVVRVSAWEVDKRIFYRSGDDGCVVNDAANVYQRAVIGIADRARLRNAGGERPFPGASLDLPVWTEVYKARFEEKRAVVAKRGGSRGSTGVMQFL